MKYKCLCKATNKEKDEPRYSQNWAFSKRAFFKIYEDRVECDNWRIKKEDILQAHVYKVKQWFLPANVLKLETNSGIYHFGFNPWAKPTKHLGIEFSESEVRLGYSPYSIIIRVGVLAIIAYEVWNYFSK